MSATPARLEGAWAMRHDDGSTGQGFQPVRLIFLSLALCTCFGSGAWAQSCQIDRDCSPGNICQRDPRVDPTRPGLCQHDPRVAQRLIVPHGVVAPRSDRDPSGRTPTTSKTPMGYAQCATDRDCPDGHACTRRSTEESWYCRRR